MANIKITDLYPIDCELFQNSESFWDGLSTSEVDQAKREISLRLQAFLRLFNCFLLISQSRMMDNTPQTVNSNNLHGIKAVFGIDDNPINDQSINAVSIINVNSTSI